LENLVKYTTELEIVMISLVSYDRNVHRVKTQVFLLTFQEPLQLC